MPTEKKIEVCSHVLNFELVKIQIFNLEEEDESMRSIQCLNEETMQLRILYEEKFISECTGTIEDNTWIPSKSTNQLRINLFPLDSHSA